MVRFFSPQSLRVISLAALVAFTTTGCETMANIFRPTPNPAKVVVRIPPESIFKPCQYVKPMAKDAFLALGMDERVEELGQKLREQLYNTSDCDGSAVFKKWRADQLQLGVKLEE